MDWLDLLAVQGLSRVFSNTTVVSSAYLRLLIFLPAILIPACAPSSGSFQVSLRITTDQESEALNKIMEVVGTFKASIRTFNVQENQRQGTYDILMKLLVPSNLELDKILSQIRAQKHVLKVNRL